MAGGNFLKYLIMRGIFLLDSCQVKLRWVEVRSGKEGQLTLCSVMMRQFTMKKKN